MKRFFTLVTILLFWAGNGQAGQGVLTPPLRISVAITPTSGTINTGYPLHVDVLTAAGANQSILLDLGDNFKTDESGVLSFVLGVTTDVFGTVKHWTDGAYNPNYLIRVTYNNVVLCIERLEVMYAKQGLFGTTIDPGEINPLETFVFHDISVGSLTPGTVEAKQLVMKDGQVTPKTITLQTPPDMSTNPSYTLTYPTTVGAVNQVLANGSTAGTLVWADASGATATDLLKITGNMTIKNTCINEGVGYITLTPGPWGAVKVDGALKILETSGSPTNYTSFQGGDQSGEITYTLPTAKPTATGQVLSATTDGGMSWVTVTATTAEGLLKNSGDMTITNGDNSAFGGSIYITPGTNGLVSVAGGLSVNGQVYAGTALGVGGVLRIRETGTNPVFYTYFQGGDQGAGITYTLPTAAPSQDGQVLAAITIEGVSVMAWADISATTAKDLLKTTGNMTITNTTANTSSGSITLTPNANASSVVAIVGNATVSATIRSTTPENWSIPVSGIANFASIGVSNTGTGKFTSLESTGPYVGGIQESAIVSGSVTPTKLILKFTTPINGAVDLTGGTPGQIVYVTGNCAVGTGSVESQPFTSGATFVCIVSGTWVCVGIANNMDG